MSDSSKPPIEHLTELERLVGAASWRREADDLWISPNLFALFGIEADSAFIMSLRDEPESAFRSTVMTMIHPDDLSSVREFVQGLSEHSKATIEFRANLSGEERVFRAVAENSDGVRTGFVQDLTDGRRAEQARADAELQFRTLAEAIPAGIHLGNRHGECEYANRALLETFKLTSADDIDWPDLIHPDDSARLTAMHSDFLKTGVIPTHRFRVFIDGDVRTLEARVSFVEGTDQTKIISSLVDQTEIDKREKRLLESLILRIA
jgi:PAS domain S-box-containing protein